MANMRSQSNISPLNRAAADTNARIADHRAAYHAMKHNQRRLCGWVMTVVLVAVMGIVVVNRWNHLQTVSAATTKAEKTLAKEKATNKKLKQQVANLNDDTYVQKYVREKYMYTKSGEVVFNLPDTSN
jgi:cell division protein DivIC